MKVLVTFQAKYKAKQGRKWVEKTSQWDETISNEADARLRAMALNWTIIKIVKA